MGRGGRWGVGGEKRGGRVGGGELKGVEGWRGWRVRGYFTAVEGFVRVGEQCGNVTLPCSSPPWSISGQHICVCTCRYGGMHT
jgi:hypothetical protein